MKRTRMPLLPLRVLTALFTGCAGGEQVSQPAKAPRKAAAASAPAALLHNVHVKDSSDRLIFRLEADKKGYAVWGPDRLLARLKVEDDRIKAEDPEGKTLLKLKHKEKRGKAEDESGETLFIVKPRGNGDYRLEDARGLVLYRIKKESYGYKVTDPADQTLYKIKVAGDNVIADGPDGKKLIEVKGIKTTLAASAVGMERFDLPVRAALFAYLAHFQSDAP